MVRMKEGNFIAIFQDRMIEVDANEKQEAYEKAKRYFEWKENRKLSDGELTVCQIPSIISVLTKS